MDVTDDGDNNDDDDHDNKDDVDDSNYDCTENQHGHY